MVAQFKRNRAFLQLLGGGDHGDVAHRHAAILLRHVEIPEPLRFSLFFQAVHERNVALDFRIAAQGRPALPPRAFKNIRRVRKLRLQRDQFVAHEVFYASAQFFFFLGQAKIHDDSRCLEPIYHSCIQ